MMLMSNILFFGLKQAQLERTPLPAAVNPHVHGRVNSAASLTRLAISAQRRCFVSRPACERSAFMRCIRDKRENMMVFCACAKMPLVFRSMVSLVVLAAVALILHPRPTSSLPANQHIPNHSYFPPHSPAARNISNMVLLYADSRSLGHKVFLIVCLLIAFSAA